jgi:hypothetical protein
MVAFSLPWAPNSGQSSAIGVSYAIAPRPASTCTTVAATPLPME